MGKLMGDDDRSAREMTKKMRSLFETIAAKDDHLVDGEPVSFQSFVASFDESPKMWSDFFEKLLRDDRRRRRRRRHYSRAPRSGVLPPLPTWHHRLLSQGDRLARSSDLANFGFSTSDGTFQFTTGTDNEGMSLSFTTRPFRHDSDSGDSDSTTVPPRATATTTTSTASSASSSGGPTRGAGAASTASATTTATTSSTTRERSALRTQQQLQAGRTTRPTRPRSPTDQNDDMALRSARSSAFLQSLLGSLMNGDGPNSLPVLSPAYMPVLSFGMMRDDDEDDDGAAAEQE
eukprot:m.164595 g.164595  ORF g.164595 m.164595 type:complete len:290 (+) comp12445_c0_seq1:298-1167(+)